MKSSHPVSYIVAIALFSTLACQTHATLDEAFSAQAVHAVYPETESPQQKIAHVPIKIAVSTPHTARVSYPHITAPETAAEILQRSEHIKEQYAQAGYVTAPIESIAFTPLSDSIAIITCNARPEIKRTTTYTIASWACAALAPLASGLMRRAPLLRLCISSRLPRSIKNMHPGQALLVASFIPMIARDCDPQLVVLNEQPATVQIDAVKWERLTEREKNTVIARMLGHSTTTRSAAHTLCLVATKAAHQPRSTERVNELAQRIAGE